MTAYIKKYLDIEKVKSVAEQKSYDLHAYELYVECLDQTLKEEEKLGPTGEENYADNVINYVCEYVDEVEKERKKGFGLSWAKEFAYIKLREENLNPPSLAYYEVSKADPPQATLDLELYATISNKDADFLRHFKRLIETDVPNTSPSPEEQAIAYSKIYKEQLQKGRSNVFADKYADIKAISKYTELGCYAEAAEYEKALEAGYSNNFAEVFALKMSNYIANYFSNYEDCLKDELVLLKAKELEKKFEHLK